MLRQNMSQAQLLQWINEVSFAVKELTLYLDTHPDDEDAMAFFHHFKDERKKALELYSSAYTPLTVDLAPNNNCWQWASDPWPWEGGCN